MNIVVLAGGLSMERDVSLTSGSLIANALTDAGHNAVLVDLYYGIERDKMKFEPQTQRYEYKIPEIAPDLEKIIAENGGDGCPVGKNVIEFCKMADVVLLALHGGVGENGKLAALLEMNDIGFTGSSSLGCAISMDKIVSKELVAARGIPTAEWTTGDDSIEKMKKMLPCFVKPCDNGSSVGVSRASNEQELRAALAEAGKYSDTVLVEREIKGRELSVGVLDGAALPPIEIIAQGEFYDYKVKYQKGLAKELCPAPIGDELTERVQEYAEKAHKALRLGSYSRIDFILGEDGVPYFLEANALPGMTPMSLLPQEAAQIGMTYTDLCIKIIDLALKKG